jgi:ABC-type multidrug transport system ATPase subunit
MILYLIFLCEIELQYANQSIILLPGKFYPGRDGNPGKFAVRGLFLAVPRGECFGMLGPNGVGKTSFINMVS